MAEALRFIDEDLAQLSYTSWTGMLAGAGTVPDDADGRAALLRSLLDGHVAPAVFSLADRKVRATWGFDALDLAWEATLVGSSGRVRILKFPDGFDLAPVEAHFVERAFRKATVGDAVVYTHDLDPSLPWLDTANLEMLNAAVLAADHELVLANRPATLDAALAARAAATGEPPAGSARARGVSVAQAMGSPPAAVIDVTAGLCQALALDRSKVAGRAAWTAIGISFGEGASGAAVTFALLFADPSVAALEADPRRRLLDEQSPITGAPYRDSVVEITDATVPGRVLLLQGTPHDGRASVVFQAWLRRDMLFAACP